MELGERVTARYGDWFGDDETSAELALAEIPDIEEAIPDIVYVKQLAEDFQADEFYLKLFQDYRAERARETQARLQAQATARAKTAANGNGNHSATTGAVPVAPPPTARSNGTSTRSRPARGEANVLSENFTGKHFPVLDIETVPPVQYELITDNFKLQEAVDYLMKMPVLAVDTETNGLDPYASKLLLVQIASPEKCFVIDATRVNLKPLKRLLESEHSLKILQNAKFDYEMLCQQAGIEITNVYDTFLAEKLLTAGLGMEANLAAIVLRYLNEKMDKTVRKTFYGANSVGHVSEDQLNYAARDVMVLFPIYTKQLQKLKERDRDGRDLLAVADLEFKCVMAVGDLELAGCKLDTVKWRSILAGVAKKRNVVREELMQMLPSGGAKQASMFGSDEYLINLNSQTQIMAEFGRLGIQLEGTSEQELNKHNHPAVKKLLEYRGYEKTIGSFGEGLLAQIHPSTGRIHPDFMQYGADTGRFSCSNPNVQQIPATSDFRSCFIPEDGYKLVVCDYSQAELRILAELSGDEGFVKAFKSGGDLHKLAASQMFLVPVDQVSKEQRSAAKAINFGLAYGMGPQGLALRIDKTVDESRALIDAYFKAFSGVQKWLEKAGKDSVRLGYSPTPLGRKRYYRLPDRTDDDFRRKVGEVERQGKNAPIQGCVAGNTRIFEKQKGYLAIEKLCGRAVSIWDGQQFSRATVVYSGKKQLVKVHLEGGYYLECSPDHRFLIQATADKEVWKTPEQFKAQDKVVLTEDLGEWAVPVETLASSYNSLSLVTSTRAGSNQLQERVRLASAERGELIPVSELQTQDLAVEEGIPDWAWQNSQKLANYLHRLFTTVGTLDTNGASLGFGQAKKNLSQARDIQQALLLFGICSHLKVLPNMTRLQVFNAEMPLFCRKIGFEQTETCKIEPKAQINRAYGKAAQIKLVETTDEWIDMYDVVNSQTERFMANGLVVHNCNADMTKMALVFLRDKLKGYDARIVNTVHDEIVVEVREDQAEVVCKLVQDEMIRAGREILKDVPIVADAKIGDYWSK